jgi:ABC-type transport system involved in multi-copper enzyme maturation permease subunit
LKGLLLKDFINLRKSGRTVFFIIAFFIVFGFTVGETTDFIQGMIVLLCSMMVINSFSYDSVAKWDKYVLSLPVGRKDVVLSKYILGLLLTGAGAVISFFMSMALGIIRHSGEQSEILMECYALFALSLLFLCLLLPLIFRFGVEKGRMLLMLVYFVPVFVIVMLANSGMLELSKSAFIFLLKLSPAVLLVGFWASYRISLQIYKNTDI